MRGISDDRLIEVSDLDADLSVRSSNEPRLETWQSPPIQMAGP